jgi:hypothetical protein
MATALLLLLLALTAGRYLPQELPTWRQHLAGLSLLQRVVVVVVLQVHLAGRAQLAAACWLSFLVDQPVALQLSAQAWLALAAAAAAA